MGCCGEKRAAWREETRRSGTTEAAGAAPGPDPNKPDRVFEYTGSRAMHINGSASGRDYFFRFPGDRQAVDHMDAFAMMAEADLKLVS